MISGQYTLPSVPLVPHSHPRSPGHPKIVRKHKRRGTPPPQPSTGCSHIPRRQGTVVSGPASISQNHPRDGTVLWAARVLRQTASFPMLQTQASKAPEAAREPIQPADPVSGGPRPVCPRGCCKHHCAKVQQAQNHRKAKLRYQNLERSVGSQKPGNSISPQSLPLNAWLSDCSSQAVFHCSPRFHYRHAP